MPFSVFEEDLILFIQWVWQYEPPAETILQKNFRKLNSQFKSLSGITRLNFFPQVPSTDANAI